MDRPFKPESVAREAAPEVRHAVLDVVVRTEFDRIRALRRCVEGLLACEGWNDDDAADVGLVVTELLQNAMEHGSRNDGAEAVGFTLTSKPEGTVEIEVYDPGTGEGFESLARRDVTAAPPLDAVRGRGLFLVHRMVESLERLRASDGGSLVAVRLRAASSVQRR